MFRGRGWSRLAARCYTANRGPGDPAHRDSNYGFRVAVIDKAAGNHDGPRWSVRHASRVALLPNAPVALGNE